VVELELAERAVRSILKDWFESTDATLTEMIKDWESRTEGEETFYTLGIRRVQDVLRGDKSIGTP
jgi:L-amino acid N-acyltransferase YncA